MHWYFNLFVSLQFFSVLIDSDALIRSAVRKALRFTRLQKVAMFRSCIDNLIKNLELYPEVCFLSELVMFELKLHNVIHHQLLLVHYTFWGKVPYSDSFGKTLIVENAK